jgi:predicted O-linked N-acetylglucosamine transferase (SPINDLY family)
MGVPVITLRGDRLEGRLDAMVLRNVGFPEWIAARIAPST